MDQERIAKFHKKLFDWWATNAMVYPWRTNRDPYYILVAEFMLQQTQASRVVPKFESFITRFPNLKTLASASNADVLQEWSGLGYNRRAIWLRDAAIQLASLNHFPHDPEDLLKIKGIGPYASRAIPIFAFNENLVTVDTNIRRVLIHEGFIKEDATSKEVMAIAEQLVPIGRSYEYHSALMDYGNLEKTARNTGIHPSGSQPKYKGSTRQIRGQVIRLLTDGELTLDELIDNFPGIDIGSILGKLEKDGLIQKYGNQYSL